MKQILKNTKGFTLIELLIALVIFAVGILGLATMQTTAIKGNSKGRQISEASNVAADRIETFLSLDYDDPLLDDDNGTHGLDDNLANSDGQYDSDGDGVNDVFWNVAFDYPVPDTKTIKIFVDPPGNRSKVVMEIIKAKPN